MDRVTDLPASPGRDLLAGPPPTLLPTDPAQGLLDAGTPARDAAATFPASRAAWAALADEAWGGGETIESYAYARTGYHRGLDALRRSGWKGRGPVPWEHVPNQGFLRALHALARAAERIGEDDEAARCRTFLAESSPTAAAVLAAGGGGR